MPIKVIEQRVVFENRWMRLYEDIIEHPDGTAGTYSWVERNDGRGGAIVVPQRPDGKLLLINAHRHVTDRWSWEFPGGGRADGESALECALRELLEETGLHGVNPRALGEFSSDAGFVAIRHTAVLVDLPENTEDMLKLDAQESISEARYVSEQEAWSMAAEGEVFCGTTLTALGLLRANRLAGE